MNEFDNDLEANTAAMKRLMRWFTISSLTLVFGVGGWAVAVMLCLLLTEVVSGLFSSTFDYEGPLARLLPDSWTDSMAAIHAVNLDLLWGMIGLHLLGVVATSILGRENLVAAMITGRKRLSFFSS